MRKPPSKDMCLCMAEFNYAMGSEPLSWDYLIAWGFYEMYVEGWWQE